MAFKKEAPPPENHERWLVSYADFITLLFAFFVVMFASSQTVYTACARFSSLSSAQSFFLQYFIVAGRTGKFCLREQNARSSRRATEDADVERAAAGLR